MRDVYVEGFSNKSGTKVYDVRGEPCHLKMDVAIFSHSHFGVDFIFMVVVVRKFGGDSQTRDEQDEHN